MADMKVNSEATTKASIEVAEHPQFNGDMKTNILTSIEMAEIVSSLFAPAFPDYYGCRVCINDGRSPIVAATMPYGALYVDLFFKDGGEAPEGMKKNIVPRGSKMDGRQDLGARFARVNGANNGRAYEVTKRTYEMLEEFMRNGNRTRWNEHTQEITSPMGVYGKDEVVVCISGLDLNRVITKIYGAKTEQGRYEYAASPSTLIPNKNQEFVMQIVQLDLATVRNLQNSLGIYTPNALQFHQYHR